jgi:hypothetical protein
MNMNRTGIFGRKICGVAFIILAVVADASAANVVQRNTVSSTNRVSATRPSAAASRMPTMMVNVGATSQSTTPAVSDTPATTTTETTTTNTPEPTPNIENKSSQFGTGLTSKSETQIDTAATNLAELVRAQRAALDAADATSAITAAAQTVTISGENSCDTALRECMIGKCGSNFAKCVSDTDTTFFDKMDTCRRTTNCTGHEYQSFSVEIKADRDLNAMLANYNATIDCGNNYDSCIIAQCGANYSKCIGKSAGDTAIAKCESIAKSCIERDSGLAMRTMGVFGELRQDAERQIATDEQKLYALRDRMRALCTRLGAMFDERSLDCVYTVNFYAGKDNTLFASKKLYAGSTFDCTQNWFGIDVTTYRENALRETRAQTAASSAMLGSGLGQAVGAFTSGAIGRAVDRFRADNALEDKINECMETHNMTESECRAKISPSSEKTDKTGNADETFKAAKAQFDDIKNKLGTDGEGSFSTGTVSSAATAAAGVATSQEDGSTKEEVVEEQPEDEEVSMSTPDNIEKPVIDKEQTDDVYDVNLLTSLSTEPIAIINGKLKVNVDNKYADAIRNFVKDERWKGSEKKPQIYKNVPNQTIEISLYNKAWTINKELHDRWLETTKSDSNNYRNDEMFSVSSTLESQYCNGLEKCGISYVGRHSGTEANYYYGCYISVPYSEQ